MNNQVYEQEVAGQENNQELESMKALRKSIESFLYRFDELAEKYGFYPSFKALRRQYIDVCCKGDVIMNDLIKGLISTDISYYVNYMHENRQDASEIKRLIDDYMLDTIQSLDETNLKLEVFY